MRKKYYRVMRRGQWHPRGLVIVDVTAENRIRFGWSLCNPVDQFSKEYATDAANNRLFEDASPLTAPVNDAAAVYEVIKKLPHSLNDDAVKLYLWTLRSWMRKNG